jgi:hypothetical protein
VVGFLLIQAVIIVHSSYDPIGNTNDQQQITLEIHKYYPFYSKIMVISLTSLKSIFQYTCILGLIAKPMLKVPVCLFSLF